jgi:hypothetical protein
MTKNKLWATWAHAKPLKAGTIMTEGANMQVKVPCMVFLSHSPNGPVLVAGAYLWIPSDDLDYIFSWTSVIVYVLCIK